MNRQVGFTRKILGVLEDNNISFDHMLQVLILSYRYAFKKQIQK